MTTRAHSSWRCCSSELGEEPESVRTLATTYAAFLHHAFDLKTKRFHNHLSFDRRWLDERGIGRLSRRERSGRWALAWGVRPIGASR